MSEFEDEISNEEKLQIATHFLVSCPPGQFNEVATDVKKLVSEEVLTEDAIISAARIVNLKTAKVVTTPGGRKALLTPAAEIDSTHYYDPVDGITFGVNHITLATEESTIAIPTISTPEEEQLNALRSLLQTKLNAYIKLNYPTGDLNAALGFVKDNAIQIVISGEKVNLRNYWSGKWHSVWKLSSTTVGEYTLTGDIKIHVHYFEDGNLQMQTSKTIPMKSFTSGADNIEQLIVNYIQSEENALQTGLEDLYVNMSNETFRSLRRVMTVTRNKMEWNVNAVRMVRQVRK